MNIIPFPDDAEALVRSCPCYGPHTTPEQFECAVQTFRAELSRPGGNSTAALMKACAVLDQSGIVRRDTRAPDESERLADWQKRANPTGEVL